MLIVPGITRPYRIMAFDPGTDTLGVAVIEVDPVTTKGVITVATTYSGKLLKDKYPDYEAIHGERAARLYAHFNNICSLLDEHQPNTVISESPYMGLFPQAYAALVECLNNIHQALNHYDSYLPLYTVDPPTAKKAVGVSGRGSNKEEVMNAVLSLDSLTFGDYVNLSELDEHSCDAIAVGYHQYKQVIGNTS